MTDIEIVDVMIKQGKLSDALQTLTHMIDKPTQPSAQLLPMLLKRYVTKKICKSSNAPIM